MFSRFKEPSHLELEVDRAIRELKNHPIGSEDYVRTLDVIVKLHKLKEEEKPSRVNKDTLAIVGTNLLGILLIINHEHVNVVSRSAMGLLMKPRI